MKTLLSSMFALLVVSLSASTVQAAPPPPVVVPPASATATALGALGERMKKLEERLVEGKCLKDHDQCQKTAESVKADVAAKVVVSGGFTRKDREMLTDIQARIGKVQEELKKIEEQLDALSKKVDAVPDSVMKLATPRFDKIEKLIKDGLAAQGCASQTQSLVIAKKADADKASIAKLANAVARCIINSSPTLDKVAEKCIEYGVECVMNTPSGPLIIEAPFQSADSGLWRIGTWGVMPLLGATAGFVGGYYAWPDQVDAPAGTVSQNGGWKGMGVGLAAGVGTALLIEGIHWLAKRR